MRKLIPMRRFLADPRYLGGKDLLGADSWRAWHVVLIAAMGETLTDDERETFRALTGRAREPGEPVDELTAVVGRRGGKSEAIAALGVYLACGIDYRAILAPGQIGLVPILSASREQASEILNFATGMMTTAPGLKGLLASPPTAETITLTSRIELQIRAASFRRARGFTAVGAIGDEVAFWRSEQSANPDVEILNALRPSLATTGGPLIVISSPYARRGEIYRSYREHYGQEGDPRILVVKASSKTMNPTLSDAFLSRAYAKDAVSAAAEFGAEFRSDIESFVSQDVVEAAVEPDVIERPPLPGVHYTAFCDPSGGAKDSMTLAIAHLEDKTVVIDVAHERRAPFSPESVVTDFAAVLKSYGIRQVRGDRYAGAWPRERFTAHGIDYAPADKPKSDLYRDLLPALNGGRVSLVDSRRLVAQIVGLERRTARGGRDSIDHPPGGHDDLANAVAGVVSVTMGKGFRTYKWSEICQPMNYGVYQKQQPLPPDWWIEQGRKSAARAARQRFDDANPNSSEEQYAEFVRQHAGLRHPMIPPDQWTAKS